MKLFDAHNHLQDERLIPHLEQITSELPKLGLVESVVAGSGAEDWPEVEALANHYSWVRPSFGVHPWYVSEQPGNWQQILVQFLEASPNAMVGEIGLDRWIKDADVPLQLRFFKTQLQMAADLKRTPTVHCLQAWGLLLETIKSAPRQARGFLLHSYGGPSEMVSEFVKLGAHFSVSPYFLHARKAAQLNTFLQVIPIERLHLETDAPDMWPPPERCPYPLLDPAGRPINDPRNITWFYDEFAKLKNLNAEDLAAILEQNHRQLFGGA
ncbi:MAG: TatD family hydrolase [Verrucomicrobiaceae bacterium]|nr:TatD family hydrolase [Verrucomicrobiaceae bacterium]